MWRIYTVLDFLKREVEDSLHLLYYVTRGSEPSRGLFYARMKRLAIFSLGF